MRVEHRFSSFENSEVFFVQNQLAFSMPTVSGTGSFPYVHTQSSPSTNWIVNHNLGYNPVIEVLSPGGIVVSSDVIHVSINQTQINFNNPQTGTVTAR